MTDSSTRRNLDYVKKRIFEAICMFFVNNKELLTVNANERSITHKLAECLQYKFPDWHVDCEYNRYGFEIKRLEFSFGTLRPNDIEAKTVFPDIVIHRRQTADNLVVIEVKKSNSRMDTKDIEKIRAFTQTSEYKYDYGLLLTLDANGPTKVDVYQQDGLRISWADDLRVILMEHGYAG